MFNSCKWSSKLQLESMEMELKSLKIKLSGQQGNIVHTEDTDPLTKYRGAEGMEFGVVSALGSYDTSAATNTSVCFLSKQRRTHAFLNSN